MDLTRIALKMLLPLQDYADGLTLAEDRGVSFTEAIHGAIATERYLRQAQKDGKRIIIEERNGMQAKEIIFWR